MCESRTKHAPSENRTQPTFVHVGCSLLPQKKQNTDVRVCQLQQKMFVLATSTFLQVQVPVPEDCTK